MLMNVRKDCQIARTWNIVRTRQGAMSVTASKGTGEMEMNVKVMARLKLMLLGIKIIIIVDMLE